MTDLSQTIAPKSDQLNADDLMTGPRTITVTRVTGNESADQPVSIFYEGDKGKPYKPCLSMRRVLVQVWGADGTEYAGRSMTLYNDPEVKFGGIKTGGIRISHMSHMDRQRGLMLTTTRGKKAEYTVKPLASTPDEEVMIRAEEAADGGKDALNEFWLSDYGKKHRAVLAKNLDALKARAVKADDSRKTLAQRLEESKAAETPEEPAAPVDEAPGEPEIDENQFEWAEGRTARSQGVSLADCPYPEDADKMAHWIAGWKAGGEEK